MVVQIFEQLTVFGESFLEPPAIVGVEDRIPGIGPLCRVAHGSSVATPRLVHHRLLVTYQVQRLPLPRAGIHSRRDTGRAWARPALWYRGKYRHIQDGVDLDRLRSKEVLVRRQGGCREVWGLSRET
jgi:hypothetical protein